MMAGDPVAEWRFDSNSGTVLDDSIGTSVGTITGSSVYNQTATAQVNVMPVWTASNPTQWGTGTQNGALRLFSDTDGAIVDAAVAPQLSRSACGSRPTTPIPRATTRAPPTAAARAARRSPCRCSRPARVAAGLNIYIYNNRLYVGAWNNGVSGWSNGTFLFTGANAIVAGRWHHVVVTLDSDGRRSQPTGCADISTATQFGIGQRRDDRRARSRSASVAPTARRGSCSAPAARAS